MKNIIERAIALTDQSRIQVIDLPPDLQKLDFKTFETLEMETLEEMEKRYITTILQRTNYNRHLMRVISIIDGLIFTVFEGNYLSLTFRK